jgi:hypothetical protein
MMSLKDFIAWLTEAAPRASIIYHTGNVARDRKARTDRDGVKHKPIAGLDALAKAVAGGAESGAAAVVQRRIGPNQWQYSEFDQHCQRPVCAAIRMAGASRHWPPKRRGF